MSVLCPCKASNSLHRSQNEARSYLDPADFSVGIPWAIMNFAISSAMAALHHRFPRARQICLDPRSAPAGEVWATSRACPVAAVHDVERRPCFPRPSQNTKQMRSASSRCVLRIGRRFADRKTPHVNHGRPLHTVSLGRVSFYVSDLRRPQRSHHETGHNSSKRNGDHENSVCCLRRPVPGITVKLDLANGFICVALAKSFVGCLLRGGQRSD
jgi:hypothetical protein